MFTVKIVFMKWFHPWLGWFQASEQYSHTFWKLSWFLAFAFLHVSCVILDVSFKIFLTVVLSEIVHSILTGWCFKWFQWSQGSVVLTWYIVTWKEEVLLVCFVSLPTICPCEAGLQVVWGFAAAATCNFQGSGVPAQPIIRWYVNSASFFISPSMFWKKKKFGGPFIGYCSTQYRIWSRDLISALAILWQC